MYYLSEGERMIIGLTGSIASGKTTVSNYLKELGYNVIDCDKIAHDVLNTTAYNKIVELFGREILDNNIINRKKLGQLVFNNKVLLEKLNNITHPLVKDEVKARLSDFCFIDCPLLFETDFINLVDKSVLIYVDRDTQIKRLINRDNLTKDDSIKRIELQMSLEKKRELANYVIDNNDSKEELYLKIKEFLTEVLK